jgi:UDP-N-acetyl-D-mannosaminuronate dehydrogenase
MPHWVLGKVIDALNARQRALNGSRVLVLGIAYKKNVDDMRESPAVELMTLRHYDLVLIATNRARCAAGTVRRLPGGGRL